MKASTVALGCLIGVVVLAMGYEYSQAQPKGDTTSSKVGTVSILKVFRNCKRSAAHRSKLITEQSRIRVEFEKLATQLQAEEDGLRALKPDSSDYVEQRKEIINKRASLEAQQEFNKEQIILKEYKLSKEIYQDILRITSELAEEKGLELVLEKSVGVSDEIDNLVLGVNGIEQTIRTHKVLYNGGCMDITDEVIAWLDEEE